MLAIGIQREVQSEEDKEEDKEDESDDQVENLALDKFDEEDEKLFVSSESEDEGIAVDRQKLGKPKNFKPEEKKSM